MRLALLAALLLSAAAGQTPDFSARGPWADTFRVEDIPGTTELLAGSRIWFPDSATSFPGGATPAPIVVFGHGWQMGIDRYYSYARHLASWGYVVVLPTISNPIINPEHDVRARLMVDAARFTAALDTIVGDRFEGKLDRWNWGFAGHSMGGGLALLAADTFGLADTLRAAVAIHSPQTTPPTHGPHLLLPKLILAGGVDNIAPWRDVRAAYWEGAPPPGAFAVIAGANHGYVMDFSWFWENGGTATITRAEQQRITRRHLTAFLERHLHGDQSEWNWAWTYGDSIQQTVTLDSVELRPELVAVESPGPALGARFAATPNPVRGRVVISYALARPGRVTIELHDATGRLARTVINRDEPAGARALTWSPDTALADGAYFLRLLGPDLATTRRITIAR
jgi:dienelactone hydrolase